MVEKGKEYKIEAAFRQIGNWPAKRNRLCKKPVTLMDLSEAEGIDIII
jgi:hypothetical protein